VPYDAGEAAGDFLIARAGTAREGPVTDRQPPMAAGGTLLVSCDSACSVSIDGDSLGTLAANAAKRIPSEPGRHIVLGTSSESAGLVKRNVVEVRAGQQEVVLLEFAIELASARAQAAGHELEGTWSEAKEWDDNFSNGDKERYHVKADRSLQISSVGEQLRGVWRETRTYTYLIKPGGFARSFEATFVMTRLGSRLTGHAESARLHQDQLAWTDLQGVVFEGSVSASSLTYKVVWTGTEMDPSEGTFTH